MPRRVLMMSRRTCLGVTCSIYTSETALTEVKMLHATVAQACDPVPVPTSPQVQLQMPHLTVVQVGIAKAQFQQLQSADLPVTVVVSFAEQLV